MSSRLSFIPSFISFLMHHYLSFSADVVLVEQSVEHFLLPVTSLICHSVTSSIQIVTSSLPVVVTSQETPTLDLQRGRRGNPLRIDLIAVDRGEERISPWEGEEVGAGKMNAVLATSNLYSSVTSKLRVLPIASDVVEVAPKATPRVAGFRCYAAHPP